MYTDPSSSSLLEDNSDEKWRVAGNSNGVRKISQRAVRSCSEGKEIGFVPFMHNNMQHSSSQHFEYSASIDSLVSRCSQCSRDGGYCSALCSSGSSRDSSEVACGDGFCYHMDDLDKSLNYDRISLKPSRECVSDTEIRCHSRSPSSKHGSIGLYAPSLTEMLDDSSCEADEIPEAEVQAWYASLGAMKQKRAELRQTLRQRFQQLCHRKSLSALNGSLNCDDFNGTSQAMPAPILRSHYGGSSGAFHVN